MPSDTKCKIAALCYTQKTNLDFQALTIEIGCALRKTGQGSTHRHDHYSDVVLFDLSDVRIALAHTDLRLEFSGDGALSEFAECLTISVSGTVDIPDAVVTSADLALLLQGVVDCIEHRLPSDQAFRFERDEIFTEVIYDQLIEHIWTMTQSSDAHAQDRARDSACTIKKQALIAIPRSAQPSGHQPDDAPPAVKTKSAHEQFSKWPTHPAAAADTKGAQALARSKGSSKEDAERIRLALYPLDENQDDALFEKQDDTDNVAPGRHSYTEHIGYGVFAPGWGILAYAVHGRARKHGAFFTPNGHDWIDNWFGSDSTVAIDTVHFHMIGLLRCAVKRLRQPAVPR